MIQPFFSDFIKMDTDWIRHEQRLSIINQKCLPEKLPYITLEFIYINKNSEVVETTSEKLPIPANTSCLSKEFIISIIHNHKKKKVHSKLCFKRNTYVPYTHTAGGFAGILRKYI